MNCLKVNVVSAITVALALASCITQPSAIVTEATEPLPTRTDLQAAESINTPAVPSDTAAPKVCPPYYGNSEIVLRVDLPSDLWGMRAADFNDDGWPDIVLRRGFTQTDTPARLEILLNDGNGKIVLGTSQVFTGSIPTVVGPRELLLADFNGDGRLDIFIADHGIDASPEPGAQNTLVLSSPDGKMSDATEKLPQVSDYTHSAAAADIDMDGDVDLYVGNIWGKNMIPPVIYLNSDGAGLFVQAKGLLPYPLEDLGFGAFTASEFADVNNDTFPDLILGDAGDDLEGGPESYVLLNDGTGHFSYLKNAIPPKPWSETNTALDIDVADINGDEYLDLFILFTKWEYQGRYVQVLINNRDGTFRDETEARLPQSENNKPSFFWVQLLDFNMDGQLDIITFPSMGDQEFDFYLNTGNGFFQPLSNPFNFTSETFTFLDIDQDGDLDALWTSVYPNEVYYLNRSHGCQMLGK